MYALALSDAPTMAPPLRRYTMHSNTTDQPTNERQEREERRDEEKEGIRAEYPA